MTILTARGRLRTSISLTQRRGGGVDFDTTTGMAVYLRTTYALATMCGTYGISDATVYSWLDVPKTQVLRVGTERACPCSTVDFVRHIWLDKWAVFVT